VPLTLFQAEILRLLAQNRSPESYVAGGIALNAVENVRWSVDVDVFHDAEEAVIRSSEADVEVLERSGCAVRRELWQPGYRRAWVTKGTEGAKMEWCQDSAWRFFPIQRDALLGWKLNRFDAVTNKALALASRSETRDVVDLVANADPCPLHAVIWAACAKDAGYTPQLLLSQMQRNARVDAAELREMGAQFEPVELKRRWLELADLTKKKIERAVLAGIEPGIAWVRQDGAIGWFEQPDCTIHRASLGGAVPRISGVGDVL